MSESELVVVAPADNLPMAESVEEHLLDVARPEESRRDLGPPPPSVDDGAALARFVGDEIHGPDADIATPEGQCEEPVAASPSPPAEQAPAETAPASPVEGAGGVAQDARDDAPELAKGAPAALVPFAAHPDFADAGIFIEPATPAPGAGAGEGAGAAGGGFGDLLQSPELLAVGDEEIESALSNSQVIYPKDKDEVSENDSALTKAASVYGRRIISTPGGWVLEELPKVQDPAPTERVGSDATVAAGPSWSFPTRVLPDVEMVDVVSEPSLAPGSRRESLQVPEVAPEPEAQPTPITKKKTKRGLKKAASSRRTAKRRSSGDPAGGCAAPHASPVSMEVVMDPGSTSVPPMHLSNKGVQWERLQALRHDLAEKEAALWHKQQAARSRQAPDPAQRAADPAVLAQYRALKSRVLATQQAVAQRDAQIRHVQTTGGGGEGGARFTVRDVLQQTVAARARFLSSCDEVDVLAAKVKKANDAILAGVDNTFNKDMKLYHASRSLKHIVHSTDHGHSLSPPRAARDAAAIDVAVERALRGGTSPRFFTPVGLDVVPRPPPKVLVVDPRQFSPVYDADASPPLVAAPPTWQSPSAYSPPVVRPGASTSPLRRGAPRLPSPVPGDAAIPPPRPPRAVLPFAMP